MEILALNLIPSLESVLNILYVAVGLGLVIFFHELGHFAVAKWCDVNVERFSIGFGPILWSRKKGETEYALSAIPFGGYVKMLGQDDMDPSQLSSEEIAEDPRSYSSKPVLQRMAIISAGVVMNILTGVLFYAVAFGFGVEQPTPVLGQTQIGMPAWTEGLEPGDLITRANGRKVESFNDIVRATLLSQGPVTIEGIREINGKEITFKKTILPVQGKRRKLGVGPSQSLTVATFEDKTISPTSAGFSAAEAKPPFLSGDIIRKVDGVDMKNFAHFQQYLSRKRSETIVVQVQRKGASDDAELTAITVGPNRFRTLGLWMDVGEIVAIKTDSPAKKAGLKKGDRILKFNQKRIGREINPLRLPDEIHAAALRGEEVELTVSREKEGGEPEELSILVKPVDKRGWTERPIFENVPLSVPAIGIAFHLIPRVFQVEEGSPAFGKIKKSESITKMELVLPEGADTDHQSKKGKPITINFDKKDDDDKPIMNWAYAFWHMQDAPMRTVTLTVSSQQGETRTVEGLIPRANEKDNWFLPIRGIAMPPGIITMVADGFVSSMQMGMKHTRDSIVDLYLTLRNLFTGRISFKELRGPVGIAKIAYRVASMGVPTLCLFLGFLSINLAVLNFLPIPVLDGGHMVFLCWEAVTRKRPSERVMVAATYFGMAVVLSLLVTVMYLDFFVHWNE